MVDDVAVEGLIEFPRHIADVGRREYAIGVAEWAVGRQGFLIVHVNGGAGDRL